MLTRCPLPAWWWLSLDYGMPQDECTDPNGPRDQGVFSSQKDQYLRGKFIRITPQALLKNNYLVRGEDGRDPAELLPACLLAPWCWAWLAVC